MRLLVGDSQTGVSLKVYAQLKIGERDLGL